MFDQHQEVANYLAVRNRNRAEQEAAGRLPGLSPTGPEPQLPWARLRALLGRIAPRRPAPRPRLRAGQMRAERR
ncbi:MAG: hypothetical protein PHY79_12070 [Anaerolineae bacterium]|jgi:hypothetical protein|nr:hypothetical protein [Anaerolineae bacterium]MDX9829741.1 hypothetical protein [Anaerolineae bacterium]